ncbi:MAG: choice-of-anchor Q domain-containing protein [Pirellulales bacterium]
MSRQSLWQWSLVSRNYRRQQPSRRHRANRLFHRRLRIEPLEDRRLLSITVNTLADELDGSIGDGDVSLRDALLAATPFEVINFDPSLTAGGPATLNLTLGELRITKDVTINGPGADLLTIDASGNDLDVTPIQNGDGSRVFNVNDGGGSNLDVKINSLTLTGGDAPLDGGAIRNFENLTTTGLVVSGNSSQRDGGGIFSSGSLTLINSTVSGNNATRDGGGVFSSGPYLTIHASNVSYNSAQGGGGGVANSAAANYLLITGSTISGNFASNNGGGVLEANGNARISLSMFNNNRASQHGGGVHSSSSSLAVIDSEFQYNRAYSNGGGIYSDTGGATVVRATITGNRANLNGGGIFSSSGDLSVTDSELRYNRAYYGNGGGGIFSETGTATIARTTIAGNVAQGSGGSGGGIWKRAGSLTVTESTINSNFARGNGGGINSDAASLSVLSSTISGNSTVNDGGGLWIQTGAGQSASISHSTVAFNRARSYYSGLGAGGGFLTSGSTIVSLTNTVVANNVHAGIADDIFGRATAFYSLIGVDSGALINNNGGSLIGTSALPIDPLLAPLADNGGPTLTHSLLTGSLAIDAGYPYYTGIPYDQRGAPFSRVRNGDGLPGTRMDIGAFEVQPGIIRGQKWNDLDGDGQKDPDEPGLPGWTIYLDANGNSLFDIESPSFASTNVPAVAPPFNTAFSTLSVSGLNAIQDVNVTVDISSPSFADIYYAYLISPFGQYSLLFFNVGGIGSNFTNTTFDDEATNSIYSGTAPFTGSFRPDQGLFAYDGQNPNGNWTLQFYNNSSFNSATLNSWSLTFTTSEPTTTTDADGNYSFLELAPDSYRVGEVQQPGWQQTTEFADAASILQNLNANNAAISALVPSRYDFSEGEFGSSIGDGGDDMYDGGNYLVTELTFGIPYTNGVATPGDFAFGPGSEYFTAKYPGLFVMGATNISINSFSIQGNNGADGGGLADGNVLATTVNGRPYTIYLKRVYNTSDPSVNHIIMVPGDGTGVSHIFDTFTDNDFHSVDGLATVDEIYYALVARANGQYLSDTDVINIADEFLTNIGGSLLQSVGVNEGQVVEGINFGNHALPGSINGQKWNDLDGDGIHDAGEPGLAGWTIFIDKNNNGEFDLTSDNLEPDDYASGTVLNNVKPGVTLSVAEFPEFDVVSGAPLASASTGSRVFGSDLSGLWFDGVSLRVDFTLPTDHVSIDAIGDNPDDLGTLSAYAQDGMLLATYDTAALDTNTVETMAISRPGADIAFVIARGAGSEAITLDNLHFGSDELSTITDVDGNYAFLGVEPGNYVVAEVLPTGWMQTSPLSLSQLLSGLNANNASIAALVPTRFDFSEGETGFFIDDGGNNMYDVGNILHTNREDGIEYTDGVIESTDAFGPGSQYFTAKYPGLFVMGASNISINFFRIAGNLGADGLGIVSGSILHTTVNGQAYTIFFKRTYNAFVPSVNHIVIVPGNGAGVTHVSVPNSDDDVHTINGLSSVKRIYYALVSRQIGGLLADADVLNIANAFLSNIATGPQIAVVGPGQDLMGVDFGNHSLVPLPELVGDYNVNGIVDAADYTLWRNMLHSQVPIYSCADGDGNGVVTWNDYLIWRANFGNVLPLGAGAGVEASAASIAALSESNSQADAADPPFFMIVPTVPPAAPAALIAPAAVAAPAAKTAEFVVSTQTPSPSPTAAGDDQAATAELDVMPSLVALPIATARPIAVAPLSPQRAAFSVARREDFLLLAWDAWESPLAGDSRHRALDAADLNIADDPLNESDDVSIDAHDCVFDSLTDERLAAAGVGL